MGLFDTGQSLVDGALSIAGTAWRGLKQYNTIAIGYRFITTGDLLTIQDRKTLDTGVQLALKLWDVVQEVRSDQESAIIAILTGDSNTLNALGEKYGKVFEFAYELILAVSKEITARGDVSAFDAGRMFGRIVGEVALVVGSGGGAAALKGATMVSVCTKLKSVSFMSRVVNRLDDSIVVYGRIDSISNDIENLARSMNSIKDGSVLSQQISSIVVRHQVRTGDKAWRSFEAFLDLTTNTGNQKAIDARVGFAASHFSRKAFMEAADAIRAGSVSEGLALVPSYRQVSGFEGTMFGRLKIAGLEAHHTAVKEWAELLDVPLSHLDDSPAYVMNKFWHQYKSNVPEGSAFHRILEVEMRGLETGTRAQIMAGLRSAYRKFDGVGADEADPDIWVVTKAWIDQFPH